MTHYYAYGYKGNKFVFILIEARRTDRAWEIAKRNLDEIRNFGELDDFLGWQTPSFRMIYLGDGGYIA